MKEVKICGNLNCYVALLSSFLGLQRWISVTRKRLKVILFKLTVLALHSVVWSSGDINSNESSAWFDMQWLLWSARSVGSHDTKLVYVFYMYLYF